MNIDDLLDHSAPPLVRRDAELADELLALVAATEGAVRPRRRRLRLALGSVAAVAVVGIGTTGAMAAGFVPTPTWVPWTTSAGETCELEFGVRAAGDGYGEPLSREYSHAESHEAVRVATEFLHDYDYEAIDEAEAIVRWQAIEDEVIAAEPDPEERQPRDTGQDLRIQAVSNSVWTDLREHFAEHDIPIELIAGGMGWTCDE